MNVILIFLFYKTALFAAVEKENVEIVRILLTNDKIDVDVLNVLNTYIFNSILNLCIFITFKILYFNEIQNQIFQ